MTPPERAIAPLDAAHRERRGLEPAQPAAQEHGGASRSMMPAASSRRPPPRCPYAATASVRMGMRAAWKAPAFPQHRSGPPAARRDDHDRATGAGVCAARDAPPVPAAVPLPRCMPAGGNKRAAGPSIPAAAG